MREVIINICIAVAAFFAGKLYESFFGEFSDYNEGWSDGFDDGMAFANECKEMIDDYEGGGVWERKRSIK